MRSFFISNVTPCWKVLCLCVAIPTLCNDRKITDRKSWYSRFIGFSFTCHVREDFVDLISSHWYTEASEVALYWPSYYGVLPLTTPSWAGECCMDIFAICKAIIDEVSMHFLCVLWSMCNSSIPQFITRKVCILVNKGPSESCCDNLKFTSKYGRVSKVTESWEWSVIGQLNWLL